MPDTVRVAQVFFDHLFGAEYAKAAEALDPAMRVALNDQILAQTATQIITLFGKPVRSIGTRLARSLSATMDIVYLTWDFEKERIDTRVVVNSATQIAGLSFETPVTR